jgi:hypothetical protein
MSDELKEILVFVFIGIVVVACLFGGAAAWENAQCNSQTSEIGFDHKWGIISGCMIETEPDKWVPLDNWRMFED